MDEGEARKPLVAIRLRVSLAAAIALAAASVFGAGHVPPTDPRIQIVGRTESTGPEEISLAYPGITLRFAYRGPAPTLLLGAGTRTCYFNLSVNGWDPVRIHPPKGRSRLPLPSGSAPEPGWVVELTRRTEAWQGIATFRGLELPEGCELLPPPPLPPRRLLFIGDSITCGEKIDAIVICLGTNDFTLSLPREEAFTQAYDRFLDEIRAAHPRAALILAESPIFGEVPGTRERAKRDLLRRCLEAATAHRIALGDERIAIAPLHRQPGTEADPHPVAFQHEQIALELMPVVRAMTGW